MKRDSQLDKLAAPAAEHRVSQTRQAAMLKKRDRDVDAEMLATACFEWSQDSETANHAAIHAQLLQAAGKLPGTGELLCIVGKCAIAGCDIHTLSTQQDVIEHCRADRPVSEMLQVAREYWRRPQQAAVALLVFSDHLEILLLDGTRQELVSTSR